MISLALLIGGLLMAIAARPYRTERAPSPLWKAMFNPTNWRPIWREGDRFNRKGFRLYVTGIICIVVGALLQLVSWQM